MLRSWCSSAQAAAEVSNVFYAGNYVHDDVHDVHDAGIFVHANVVHDAGNDVRDAGNVVHGSDVFDAGNVVHLML